jgi:hypothetical protein
MPLNDEDRDLPPGRETREHGSLLGNFILIDTSLTPSDNSSRLNKIGQHWQTFGAAVVDADQANTKKVVVGNGITNKLDGTQTIRTIFPFEPDNWVLRFHDNANVPAGFTTTQSGMMDRVWGLRLITDADNMTGSKPNRSTPIIDQGKTQQIGLLGDVIKIVDSGAPQLHLDTYNTKAGYLAVMDALYRRAGLPARGAAAINICRNAFVTDGDKYAPWSHILTWLPPPAYSPSGQQGTQVQGRPAVVQGGRANKQGELGILASSGFKYRGGLVVSLPKMEKAPSGPSDTGKPAIVHFYPGGVIDNLQDTALDALNNQVGWTRHNWPGIAAYVKIPPPSPPDPSYPDPNPWHDDSYHGGTSDGSGSSMDTGSGTPGSTGKGNDDSGSGTPNKPSTKDPNGNDVGSNGDGTGRGSGTDDNGNPTNLGEDPALDDHGNPITKTGPDGEVYQYFNLDDGNAYYRMISGPGGVPIPPG